MWEPYVTLPSSQRKLLGASAVLVVLGLWSLITGLELVSPASLPSPLAVLKAFFYLLWDSTRGFSPLLNATISSVSRILISGVMVVLIGIPIGVLMGASPKINAALSPLIDPFRSAPVVALLPIMVMWMGIGETMKISFLFAGAVVYLIPMVRDAMTAVPSSFWIKARDVGATPWESVRLSMLPMAMPRIADAVIASVSIMWTYITVAEYVNATSGLGYLISTARKFSATDQVLVGIFTIIALAMLTYQSMIWLKRKLFQWEIA